MKKIFITTAIAALFSVTAFAGDGDKKTNNGGEVNVSYTALSNFKADFKKVKNVTWVVTPNCQKATFDVDGTLTTAFYNLDGQYLGETQNVSFTAVPAEAQKEITAKYAAYPVKEVIKFQYEGTNASIDPLVYFVDLKKADSEIVLKVTNDDKVSFYKQVK